uniref:Uncharacterized protein n=1 Tax=Micrurus surinamensis TaxID=129470 RepID=A0A2D4Q3F9_MICSU
MPVYESTESADQFILLKSSRGAQTEIFSFLQPIFSLRFIVINVILFHVSAIPDFRTHAIRLLSILRNEHIKERGNSVHLLHSEIVKWIREIFCHPYKRTQ